MILIRDVLVADNNNKLIIVKIFITFVPVPIQPLEKVNSKL